MVGLVAALLVPTVVYGTQANRPAGSPTTYTVRFLEEGLPSGANWSVTFAGTTLSSTSGTISFVGVSAGNLTWKVSSPVVGAGYGKEFTAAVPNGTIGIPGQLAQAVAFDEQVEVRTIVSPSAGYGSISPSGSSWVPLGSERAFEASAADGFRFVGWSVAGNATVAATQNTSAVVDFSGPANLTGTFAANSYPVTVSEFGLRPGTDWSASILGVLRTTNGSSMAIPALAGLDFWSTSIVPTKATGVEYIPVSSNGLIRVPEQQSLLIVFTKEFQVGTMALPPTGGTVSPSSTAYYPDGSPLLLGASPASGSVFAGWSTSTPALKLLNSSLGSTVVTVRGTGTVTGRFATGTACSSCNLTFSESGLGPAAGGHVLTWRLTVNGTSHLVTNRSAVFGPFKSGASVCWNVTTPVRSARISNLEYAASPSSGCLTTPGERSQTIVFTREALVVFGFSTLSYGAVVAPSSGFFPTGDRVALSLQLPEGYRFSGWSVSNATTLLLSNASAPDPLLTVRGPGTVDAAIAPLSDPVTFRAVGLPAGASWNLTAGGKGYPSTSAWINLTTTTTPALAWTASAGPGLAYGVEYVALPSSGNLSVAGPTGLLIVFEPEFDVGLSASGTAGGSVSPAGSQFYPNGTVLAVAAINGSSATFSAWSSSSSLVAVAAPSQAATWVTIRGPANVTATFI